MTPLPPWTPFARATYPEEVIAKARAAFGDDVSRALEQAEVWRNSRFQVAVRRGAPNGFDVAMTWLSIKTLHPPHHRHDWRELQRVKNELCGPDCEALELYPDESRLHDTADQFHLWVFPAGVLIPIGFAGRHVTEGEVPGSGTQRPFDPRPSDVQDSMSRARSHPFTPWIVNVIEGIS